MENRKHMEIEILVAIRNNKSTPADEFYKIFDYQWLDYRKTMISLFNKGLFTATNHNKIPGLIVWELTGAGECRLTELLLERSDDLSKRVNDSSIIYALSHH
jgi:hypothetical protein